MPTRLEPPQRPSFQRQEAATILALRGNRKDRARASSNAIRLSSNTTSSAVMMGIADLEV
jgi:hypothetical protein